MRLVGRRYDTGEAAVIELSDGRISRIRPYHADSLARQGQKLPWISPGFVDVQINGYGGHEFNEPDLTVETVAAIARSQDACGVVAFCPTTTTHSQETLLHSMRTIAKACDALPDVARRIAGIHVEGPYISSENGPRGAHPLEHVRPPNLDEFRALQDASGGRIIILTMSPEYDGSAAFIRHVVEMGVRVAIGHTKATGDQIRAAVDAGANFSTHLGNAAHLQIRRHPNYIWEQLAEDRLQATLIVDGHHLPPSVVKSFVRGKTPERCLLVSDITGMSGMPPGRYERTSLGAIEILEDGKLVVAGQRELLAGASLPISVGVVNVRRFAGVDLRTAIEMASVKPAQLIGHPVARLEVGAPADLIQFHLNDAPDVTALEAFALVATLQQGEPVFGDPYRIG